MLIWPRLISDDVNTGGHVMAPKGFNPNTMGEQEKQIDHELNSWRSIGTRKDLMRSGDYSCESKLTSWFLNRKWRFLQILNRKLKSLFEKSISYLQNAQKWHFVETVAPRTGRIDWESKHQFLKSARALSNGTTFSSFEENFSNKDFIFQIRIWENPPFRLRISVFD